MDGTCKKHSRKVLSVIILVISAVWVCLAPPSAFPLTVEQERELGREFLAKSYQDQEEYAKAIPLYEKLAAMQPVKNEVFYNLGVSYGKVGKLALAHYNLGIFFRRKGDAEKAGFHFRKATDLASGDPKGRWGASL
jgi:tetratricopeptide (TPR) repeat protein